MTRRRVRDAVIVTAGLMFMLGVIVTAFTAWLDPWWK